MAPGFGDRPEAVAKHQQVGNSRNTATKPARNGDGGAVALRNIISVRLLGTGAETGTRIRAEAWLRETGMASAAENFEDLSRSVGIGQITAGGADGEDESGIGFDAQKVGGAMEGLSRSVGAKRTMSAFSGAPIARLAPRGRSMYPGTQRNRAGPSGLEVAPLQRAAGGFASANREVCRLLGVSDELRGVGSCGTVVISRGLGLPVLRSATGQCGQTSPWLLPGRG